MVVDHVIHCNFDLCFGGKITPREVAVASVSDKDTYMLFPIREDYRTMYATSDILWNQHKTQHGHRMHFPPEDKEKLPSIQAVCKFFEQSFPDTTVFGCWGACAANLRELFGLTHVVDIAGDYEMTDETAPAMYKGHHVDDCTVQCSLTLAWTIARALQEKQRQQQRIYGFNPAVTPPQK